ncbi:MAG: hypothetical protein RJA99_1605 [Pseudomonadota bacterium]|jgi:hypothetical protein
MIRRLVSIVTISAAVLAAGCASTDTPGGAGASGGAGGPSAAVPVPARPTEPTEGRKVLDRAVALFEQGRFAESMRLLQESPEILADGPQVRVQALKTLAFGQCVTGRRAACRRSFDAALALEPAFGLAPAEAGHPSWGPEFERARAAVKGGTPSAPVAAHAVTATAPVTASKR